MREITPDISHIEPPRFEKVAQIKSEDLGTSNEVSDNGTSDEVNDFLYVANHRRPQPKDMKLFLRFCVPQHVAAKHPVKPHQPDGHHFRTRCWYAVAKGYDISVFFDFWYVSRLF
jgi:hypothetical protein